MVYASYVNSILFSSKVLLKKQNHSFKQVLPCSHFPNIMKHIYFIQKAFVCCGFPTQIKVSYRLINRVKNNILFFADPKHKLIIRSTLIFCAEITIFLIYLFGHKARWMCNHSFFQKKMTQKYNTFQCVFLKYSDSAITYL